MIGTLDPTKTLSHKMHCNAQSRNLGGLWSWSWSHHIHSTLQIALLLIGSCSLINCWQFVIWMKCGNFIPKRSKATTELRISDIWKVFPTSPPPWTLGMNCHYCIVENTLSVITVTKGSPVVSAWHLADNITMFPLHYLRLILWNIPSTDVVTGHGGWGVYRINL